MAAAPKVLTVNELADYLRVHRSTIYRLLKKGQLPGFKIGSDWRFNVEVIDEWRSEAGGWAPRRGGGRGNRALATRATLDLEGFSALKFEQLGANLRRRVD